MAKKTSSAKHLVLNHFIDYDLWQSGKALLDFQISIKQDKSKNYYNNLNFFYFESIANKTLPLSSESYFKQKIANNVFYALDKEFTFSKYPLPKTGVSVRNYTFLSYPMAVLYQSIGIYLARISNQFVIDNQSINIHSYYGGSIKFTDDKYAVALTPANVSYFKHYKEFLKNLETSTTVGPNKWAIKLDVKDYFENIDITKLLSIIKQRVKPSILLQYKYDVNTIEQLDFFFKFLSHGGNGIPQADSNLASSYISYLYLLIGDLIIEDCIKAINAKTGGLIRSYKIIRYVDDICILLDIPTTISKENFANTDFINTDAEALRITDVPHFLLERIANEFYIQLGLAINNKARVHHLLSNLERIKFLNRILLSNDDICSFDNNNPAESFKKVILGLNLLNKLPLTKTISGGDILDQTKELLKCVFNNKFFDLAQIPSNKTELHNELNKLNFNKCHISPKALTLLICNDPIADHKFKLFAHKQTPLTISTRNIVVHYMCHKHFNHSEPLFKILKRDSTIAEILSIFESKKVVHSFTNYPGVDFNQFRKVFNYIPLMEQIRLRAYHERTSNFSICLNLLLNELHCTCFHLDINGKDIHSYKAHNVLDFLSTKGVDSALRAQMSTLFDRRNNNPFSHPGSDSRQALNVGISEYALFKSGVERTMQTLLN